jgi:glucosamine 6-phosphate synthetase-like amidotransferase/phosphosugar isomerase protein
MQSQTLEKTHGNVTTTRAQVQRFATVTQEIELNKSRAGPCPLSVAVWLKCPTQFLTSNLGGGLDFGVNMCGIVGYVGYRNATEVLLNGLSKLEYRGYDSAGIAVNVGGHLELRKAAGKLQVLRSQLEEEQKDGAIITGRIGVGHTRWATHGKPNDLNAHPHASEDSKLAVIHNGILENYLSLKAGLLERGHVFLSETDTEVFVHLIEEKYDALPASQDRLELAVRAALKIAEGAYGLVVTHVDHTEIVAARTVSPLVSVRKRTSWPLACPHSCLTPAK